MGSKAKWTEDDDRGAARPPGHSSAPIVAASIHSYSPCCLQPASRDRGGPVPGEITHAREMSPLTKPAHGKCSGRGPQQLLCTETPQEEGPRSSTEGEATTCNTAVPRPVLECQAPQSLCF